MKTLLFLIITALGWSRASGGGPSYYFYSYLFINLPSEYNSSAKTSICLTYQVFDDGNVNITSSFGAQDCSGITEVVLVGRYIHLGLHNQGSFGTQICLYYPVNTILPSALGLMVDYDRNGFNSENASVPGYVGDLAISPYPVEGDR